MFSTAHQHHTCDRVVSVRRPELHLDLHTVDDPLAALRIEIQQVGSVMSIARCWQRFADRRCCGHTTTMMMTAMFRTPHQPTKNNHAYI
jgi:hypothetical protein